MTAREAIGPTYAKLNNLNQPRRNVWFLDSGATRHVACEKLKMADFRNCNNIILESASGEDLEVTGTGTSILKTDSTQLTLSDVLYTTKVKGNFDSVSKLNKSNIDILFTNRNNQSVAIATFNGDIVFIAVKEEDEMYVIQTKQHYHLAAITTNERTPDEQKAVEWHRRLGHLNYGDLLRLKQNLNIDRITEKLDCEVCLVSKCHRLPFRKRSIKSTEPLQMIHTDTSGTIRTSNIHNYNSFLIFIDDFTRYTFVYFLKSKSEVLKFF